VLSVDEFNNLAKLARLDPEDSSLKHLREDFNKILGYVEQINALDTSGSVEFKAPNETENVTRPDSAGAVLETRTLSQMAPEWESGHFVVPGVIESEN